MNYYLVEVDEVLNGVIADVEVFAPGMPLLILSELTHRLVVAEQGRCVKDGHVEAIKKLAEEKNLLACTVDGDVFGIASRI